MGIQLWSENIILVDLSKEPEMSDELNAVAEMVRDKVNYDVVIDFSSVDIVTSSNLSKLLNIHKPLADCRRRLILCGIDSTIKGVFTVTGLDKIFEIVDDKFIALATLEMIG
jgi:anti-sigma B factor antagonist